MQFMDIEHDENKNGQMAVVRMYVCGCMYFSVGGCVGVCDTWVCM